MKEERNFIVSDLHGNMKIYEEIITYLENFQKENQNLEVILYINGDIIDRGADSIAMLLDVIDRVKEKKGIIKVRLLAGNHEWMMQKAIQEKRKNAGKWNANSDWFYGSNGGQVTARDFDKLSTERQVEVMEFIDNLSLWKTFGQKMGTNEGIVLVHAYPPKNILAYGQKVPTLTTANEKDIISWLWTRREDLNGEPIGLESQLTIIGHTPVWEVDGYEYTKKDNVLCIDGGCAVYALGDINTVTVPVVELDFKKQRIDIHLFNQNGVRDSKKCFYDASIKESQVSDNKREFIKKVRASYKKVRKIEKQKPFLKRHTNLEKALAVTSFTGNKFWDSIIAGGIHIGFEMVYQMKKLLPIVGDNLINWTIRNRKSLAIFTFWGTLNIAEFFKEKVESDIIEDVEINRTYEIQVGDTLSEIAKNYGVEVETLMEENNINDANAIYSGEKISIPYAFKFDNNLKIDDVTDTIQTTQDILLEEYAIMYDTNLDTLESLNPNYSTNSSEILVPNFQEIEEYQKSLKLKK